MFLLSVYIFSFPLWQCSGLFLSIRVSEGLGPVSSHLNVTLSSFQTHTHSLSMWTLRVFIYGASSSHAMSLGLAVLQAAAPFPRQCAAQNHFTQRIWSVGHMSTSVYATACLLLWSVWRYRLTRVKLSLSEMNKQWASKYVKKTSRNNNNEIGNNKIEAHKDDYNYYKLRLSVNCHLQRLLLLNLIFDVLLYIY